MTREERLVVQAAVLADRAVLSVQTRYGQAQYRALLARERMERVELAARRRVARWHDFACDRGHKRWSLGCHRAS